MRIIITALFMTFTQILSAQIQNPTLDNWIDSSPMFPFEHLEGWKGTSKVIYGDLNISVTKQEEGDRIFARVESNQAWTDATGPGYIEQENSTQNLKSITYVSRCDSIEALGACIVDVLGPDGELIATHTTSTQSDTFSQRTLEIASEDIEGFSTVFLRFTAFGSGTVYPDPNSDGHALFDIDNVKADFISNVDNTILDVALLDLYPNPSSGVFQLSLSKNLITESMLVYNLQGKLVWSGEYSTSLDLGQLPNGNYIISVQTKEGMVSKLISKEKP